MIALIFMFLVILRENGFFWNIVFILLSIILFFVCATGIMQLEIPYQFYNITTDTVETGYHQIHLVENVYLSYFFYGLAVIMLIYFVAYVYTYIGNKPWMKQ
jgi:hypothetical protein